MGSVIEGGLGRDGAFWEVVDGWMEVVIAMLSAEEIKVLVIGVAGFRRWWSMLNRSCLGVMACGGSRW